MFWGLIMEPNKRYTQVVEKPFHISQAAMDISTGDTDPCQVMVVVEGKNFLVCTLQKNKTIQVPLDLYFKSGDSVSFLTNGKCNVHLTGYLDPEYEEDLSDEEVEEEEEEAAPSLVTAKNKRKLENSNEVSANKKLKKEKKAVKADESSDDDDDEEVDHLQKLLDGEDIDTDDNDDSFKVNTSAEADSDDDSEEDEDEAEEEGDDDEEEEADSDAEAETTVDTTLETSKEEEVDMSKLSKSQRRRLKKRLKQQEQGKAPQVNGVDKAKKQPDGQEQKDKKDKKKQHDVKKEEGATDKKEKKVVSGGVQIEDLKVGSGPVAKPGKTVAVFYEGRLKQNNKMFDNCTKGAGFKFRLGAKEVISGWDVGVAGMKVGGKRRIVCPPTMAYGAKGSPPVIPPNSTLVFEVELKNVK